MRFRRGPNQYPKGTQLGKIILKVESYHPEQGSTRQLDMPSEARKWRVDPEEIRHFRRAGSWQRGLKWAVCPIQRLWQTLVGLFSQMVTFRVHSGGCCSPLKQPLLFLTKICLFSTKISLIFIPKFKKMTKLKKVQNFLKILFLLVISSQMSIWTPFFGEMSLVLTKFTVFYVSHAQSTLQKRFSQNYGVQGCH